jgi:tRNA (mo5U34)-methyltransferase
MDKDLKWNLSVPDLNIAGNMPIGCIENIYNSIPQNLENKSVLDLGAWDGSYSFIASKRGAKIVIAIDNGIGEEIMFGPCNNNAGAGSPFPNMKERELAINRLFKKYDHLNNNLKTHINFFPMDVEDIDKFKMKFDYIFCFGLYYHIDEPYTLFKKCFNLLNEGGTLLLEGCERADASNSVMYFNDKYELNNDPTNVWAPTEECLFKMLKRIGFKTFERYNRSGVTEDGKNRRSIIGVTR